MKANMLRNAFAIEVRKIATRVPAVVMFVFGQEYPSFERFWHLGARASGVLAYGAQASGHL